MGRILTVLLSSFLFCVSCFAGTVEVTSPFGWRMHPIYGYNKFHTGVDLGYSYGSPVGALDAGTVALAGWYGGYGNCVIVRHPNGDSTLYGHLARVCVRPGEVLDAGRLIGYSGSTGVSTGPHLHVEWWHAGQYLDPLALFENGGRIQGARMAYSGMYVASADLVQQAEKEGPGWMESQLAFLCGNNGKPEPKSDKLAADTKSASGSGIAAVRSGDRPGTVVAGYSMEQQQQIDRAEAVEREARKPKDSLWFPLRNNGSGISVF